MEKPLVIEYPDGTETRAVYRRERHLDEILSEVLIDVLDGGGRLLIGRALVDGGGNFVDAEWEEDVTRSVPADTLRQIRIQAAQYSVPQPDERGWRKFNLDNYTYKVKRDGVGMLFETIREGRWVPCTSSAGRLKRLFALVTIGEPSESFRWVA
jgi:hypothetical protein